MPNLTSLADWAQIISVPLALIAIITSVWLHIKGRPRRRLSCTFDPILFPIEIKGGEGLEGDIEIRYGGRQIENLFIIRARLQNSGTEIVRASDIIQPISFEFGPTVELVRAPIVQSKKPDTMKTGCVVSTIESTSEAKQMVILDFDVFNPGDELTLNFLCTGDPILPELSARIEGISDIRPLDSIELELRKQAVQWLLVVAASGLFIAGLVWLLSGTPDQVAYEAMWREATKDVPPPGPFKTVLFWVLGIGSLSLILGVFFLPLVEWVYYRVHGKRLPKAMLND